MAAGFAQWGNDLYTGRRSYDIVGRRKIWFTISTVLVVLSAIFLIKPGLNPGIEFRGGSEFVVSGVSDTGQQLAIDTVTAIVARRAAEGHDRRRRLAAHPDRPRSPRTR